MTSLIFCKFKLSKNTVMISTVLNIKVLIGIYVLNSWITNWEIDFQIFLLMNKSYNSCATVISSYTSKLTNPIYHDFDCNLTIYMHTYLHIIIYNVVRSLPLSKIQLKFWTILEYINTYYVELGLKEKKKEWSLITQNITKFFYSQKFNPDYL